MVHASTSARQTVASAATKARLRVSSTAAATGASEDRAARRTSVPSSSGVETKRYASPPWRVLPSLSGGMTVFSDTGGEEATTSSPSATTIASISRTPAALARRWTSDSSRGTPTTTRPTVSPSSSTTSTARLAGHDSLPARSSSPATSPTFSSVRTICSAASLSSVARARCTCSEAASRLARSSASASVSANSSRPTRRFAVRRVSTVSRSWLSAILPATQVATRTTTATSSSAQRASASFPRAARGGNLANVAVVPPSLGLRILERGRPHVGSDQQEDECRCDEAVDDEDRVVVPPHVAKQAPDGDEPASGRREDPDDERPLPARRAGRRGGRP